MKSSGRHFVPLFYRIDTPIGLGSVPVMTIGYHRGCLRPPVALVLPKRALDRRMFDKRAGCVETCSGNLAKESVCITSSAPPTSQPRPAFPRNAAGYRRFALSDRSVGAVHSGWGLCELDAGGHIDLHVQSFEKSFYVLAGNPALILDGRGYRLSPGACGVIPGRHEARVARPDVGQRALDRHERAVPEGREFRRTTPISSGRRRQSRSRTTTSATSRRGTFSGWARTTSRSIPCAPV